MSLSLRLIRLILSTAVTLLHRILAAAAKLAVQQQRPIKTTKKSQIQIQIQKKLQSIPPAVRKGEKLRRKQFLGVYKNIQTTRLHRHRQVRLSLRHQAHQKQAALSLLPLHLDLLVPLLLLPLLPRLLHLVLYRHLDMKSTMTMLHMSCSLLPAILFLGHQLSHRHIGHQPRLSL